MNRVDRLFGILLLLQKSKILTAEEVAKRYEISVRTVYRDMAALSEMGIPLAALPGEGYSLMEGYFLPPLFFNAEEATALVLGARMLAGQATGKLPDEAEHAIHKIIQILPKSARVKLEHLSQVIQFFISHRSFSLDDPLLLDLQCAIAERRLVSVSYYSLRGNELSERIIEPQQLTYSEEGAWYVTAYCRLRQEVRSFRLNRIEQYKLLQEQFTYRELRAAVQPIIVVRVRFASEIVRWLQERQHYGFIQQIENEFIYHVHDLREIQSWILGWGSLAEVIAPQELREWLRNEAKKLAEILT